MKKVEVEIPQSDRKALEEHKDLLARTALAAAGFQPSFLKKALKRTVEALDAKDTKVATFEGKFSDERTFVDHRTRLEAADRIFKMVPGIYAKEHRDAAGTVTVEIVTVAPDGSKVAVKVGPTYDSKGTIGDT